MRNILHNPSFKLILIVLFFTFFSRGCSQMGETFMSIGFPFPWLAYTLDNGVRIFELVSFWYIALVIDLVFFYGLWRLYKDKIKSHISLVSLFFTAFWVTIVTSILVIPDLAETGIGYLTIYLIYFPLSFVGAGIEALGIIPDVWRVDSFIFTDINARIGYLLFILIIWGLFMGIRKLSFILGKRL